VRNKFDARFLSTQDRAGNMGFALRPVDSPRPGRIPRNWAEFGPTQLPAYAAASKRSTTALVSSRRQTLVAIITHT
jgi:hypothetical protein